MKQKIFGALIAASTFFAVPASAQSIIVVTSPKPDQLQVAYEALQAGDNSLAIQMLRETSKVDARDPSRLINLGTAYARTGQMKDAKAAFAAAAASPIRYDVELANGRYVDSRWAARTALRQLQTAPQNLAMAL